jgi:hypothetical protein
MFRSLFIAIFVLCFGFQNYARAQDDFDPNQISDTRAYQETLKLCSQVSNQDGNPEFSWDMTEIIKTGTVSGWKLWGDDALQLSKSTDQLIHSKGYEAALDECYGPASSSKEAYYSHKAFTAAVICADAGGHIVGLLGWMIPISYFSKLFLASKWALANPEIVKAGGWVVNGVNKLALAGLAGYVGWEYYKRYDTEKNGAVYLKQYNDEMVNATHDEADATYSMVLKALADVDAELAKGVTDPDQQKYLLAKKAALEERVRAHNAPPAPETDATTAIPAVTNPVANPVVVTPDVNPADFLSRP